MYWHTASSMLLCLYQIGGISSQWSGGQAMPKLFALFMLAGLLVLTACGGGPSFTGFNVTNGSFDLWIDVVMYGNGRLDLGRLFPGDVISVVAEPGVAYSFVGRWEDGVDDLQTATVPNGSVQEVIFVALGNGGGGGPPPPPSIARMLVGVGQVEGAPTTSNVYRIYLAPGPANFSDPDVPIPNSARLIFGPDTTAPIGPGTVNGPFNDQLLPEGDGLYRVWFQYLNGQTDYWKGILIFNGDITSVDMAPPPTTVVPSGPGGANETRPFVPTSTTRATNAPYAVPPIPTPWGVWGGVRAVRWKSHCPLFIFVRGNPRISSIKSALLEEIWLVCYTELWGNFLFWLVCPACRQAAGRAIDR